MFPIALSSLWAGLALLRLALPGLALLGLALFGSSLLTGSVASAAEERAYEERVAHDERAAYIDVAGAPGDGKQALESALSDRLLDKGFSVTGTPVAEAYEIQGMVRLFPAERGRETVRIDWTVFGPQGTRLGNVTQTNVIRKGSLDRRWGAAAEAAASAAAIDILQYIPQ